MKGNSVGLACVTVAALYLWPQSLSMLCNTYISYCTNIESQGANSSREDRVVLSHVFFMDWRFRKKGKKLFL